MKCTNIVLISLVLISSSYTNTSAAPIPSDWSCSSSRYGCHRSVNGPFASLAAQTMSSVSDWAAWVSDWIPLLILNIPSYSHGTVKRMYSCHPSHHAHHDSSEDYDW